MELPSSLRRGIDRMLEGVPLAELRHSADLLSRRYRVEIRDGKLHLADELAVKAEYPPPRRDRGYSRRRVRQRGVSR